MRTLIMPMAGKGTRISSVSACKVLTPIGEKKEPMFLHSLRNVGVKYDKVIFISQKKHNIAEILKGRADFSCPYELIEIEEDTAGPLDTVKVVGPILQNLDSEILFINSDQVVDWPGDWALDWFMRKGANGGIPTVKRSSPRHSYVKIDQLIPHKVIDIAEKDVISDRATIGFYWFRSGRVFWEAARRVLENPGERVNGEYYISSVYRYLDGLTLEFPVCDFWSIGESHNLKLYLEGTPQTDRND